MVKEFEISNSLTDNDRYLAYAKLFRAISVGEKNEANQFADLLREITNNSIEFNDNEVFSIAAECEKVFSGLAKGNIEIGLQDVTVNNSNKHITLEITYIGEISYAIKKVTDLDGWYVGEQLMPYNGELGTYTFEIAFFDQSPSREFISRYPTNSIHELCTSLPDIECSFNFKGVFTPEHGYTVYIGCDTPFEIQELGQIISNCPMGKIEIPIHFI